MASTYEPIATTTLGSAATFSFTSIASTYTDLQVILSGAVASNGYPLIRFNSDSTTNYSNTILTGDGTTATSNRNPSAAQLYGSYYSPWITTVPSFLSIDLFSYAGSTFKTCLITNNADQNGSGLVERSVGLYRNTSAISSLQITLTGGGNYAAGTTATLYGIKNA